MSSSGSNDLWPEDPKGGDIVPLTRGSDGKLHFSWPNAIRGAVNSTHELFTAPSDAMGGKYTPQEMVAPATRMALTMAGLGSPLPAEENALRMFGGVRAKTADMPALGKALTLEGRGAAPKDIHAATGWFRGPDNKWRFEIPDSEAMLHGQNMVRGNLDIHGSQIMPLDEVLHHPDLYAAYPQLKDTRVTGKTGGPGSGVFYPDENKIAVGQGDGKTALSTMLHETQHGVQHIEDFAEGGSPDQFLTPQYWNQVYQHNENWNNIADSARQLNVDPHAVMTGMKRFSQQLPLGSAASDVTQLGKQAPDLLEAFRQHYNNGAQLLAEKKQSVQSYKDLAGEVEARNVQERHEQGDFTSWPLGNPGYPGYTPLEHQIVVLDGKEQPRLAVPVDHDPFAAAGLAISPVEHDPWSTSATPVDHDPFATEEGAAKP